MSDSTLRDEIAQADPLEVYLYWLARNAQAYVVSSVRKQDAERGRELIEHLRDMVLRGVAEQIEALRERDCPYLGNYKLGYDAALDDVLRGVGQPTNTEAQDA